MTLGKGDEQKAGYSTSQHKGQAFCCPQEEGKQPEHVREDGKAGGKEGSAQHYHGHRNPSLVEHNYPLVTEKLR